MENQERKITKEEIGKWVMKDIENSVSILNLIRNDKEILAAVVDIVTERVRVHEEAKAAQPELNLNGQ